MIALVDVKYWLSVCTLLRTASLFKNVYVGGGYHDKIKSTTNAEGVEL